MYWPHGVVITRTSRFDSWLAPSRSRKSAKEDFSAQRKAAKKGLMRKICQEAFELVGALNDELGPHLPMSFSVSSDGYGVGIEFDGTRLFDSENDSLYADNDDEITLRDFVLRALSQRFSQIGAALDKLKPIDLDRLLGRIQELISMHGWEKDE